MVVSRTAGGVIGGAAGRITEIPGKFRDVGGKGWRHKFQGVAGTPECGFRKTWIRRYRNFNGFRRGGSAAAVAGNSQGYIICTRWGISMCGVANGRGIVYP